MSVVSLGTDRYIASDPCAIDRNPECAGTLSMDELDKASGGLMILLGAAAMVLGYYGAGAIDRAYGLSDNTRAQGGHGGSIGRGVGR